MQSFLITSLIASIILTVLINLLPMIFPNGARKMEQKIVEKVQEVHRNEDEGNRRRVRVFFPWKTMLLLSFGLTVLINLVGALGR